MVSEIVAKNVIKREQGYLYFVDKDGNVCRAKMQRRTKNVKK
jgi:hypothetical protein